MTEFHLKTRIAALLVTLLAGAMLLQSAIHLFLGMRAGVENEVDWSIRSLNSLAAQVATTISGENVDKDAHAVRLKEMQIRLADTFSCTVVEWADQRQTGPSCRSTATLINQGRLAREANESRRSFVGGGWQGWLFGYDGAIMAVPIHAADGRVVGSVSGERSLAPIVSRYRQEALLAFLYLFVNTIILATLGFFRIVRSVFKPLERLVRLAEQYHPDEQTLFLTTEDNNDFRKLSSSLTNLLDRIERDNRRLRQTVSELEVANRQLQEKKDLVLRSEKLASVGRLSAGLAHEIGNPLTIVQGYVELLGRKDLSCEERTKFAGKAMEELARIHRLIRRLLDFAGTGRMGAEPLAVNALITDVLAFVTLEKSFTGCRIVTRLDARHDRIVADSDALRQVLINCLFNAADAIAENGGSDGEIILATTNDMGEGGDAGALLVITIADNGPGIDEAHLATIFDPFFTTKEVGRGTGLGLFVCHTIMEGIGGSITLANRSTAGAEVRLTIPLAEPLDS